LFQLALPCSQRGSLSSTNLLPAARALLPPTRAFWLLGCVEFFVESSCLFKHIRQASRNTGVTMACRAAMDAEDFSKGKDIAVNCCNCQ
ncbi:hypothetical protein ANCCAN_22947, partial [Ancylostoma caninum]